MKTITCPNCGAPVDGSIKKCPYCDTVVNENGDDIVRKNNDNKEEDKSIILPRYYYLVSICLGLFIGLCFYLIGHIISGFIYIGFGKFLWLIISLIISVFISRFFIKESRDRYTNE